MQIKSQSDTMDQTGCSLKCLTVWLDYTKSIHCDDEEEDTHMDNFIPLSAYDMNNPIDLQNATNWTNIRIIPAKVIEVIEEISRHNRMIQTFLNSL